MVEHNKSLEEMVEHINLLNMSLFMKANVPNHESDPSCKCVVGVYNGLFFYRVVVLVFIS
jgi:hypothetical protein